MNVMHATGIGLHLDIEEAFSYFHSMFSTIWDKHAPLKKYWLFRALRNKCTLLIRKCKSSFYYESTKSNLNNPPKLWKTIKSFNAHTNSSGLLLKLTSNSMNVTDKNKLLDKFN
ncbi:unnamed protein product, partial [Coregonus sp. 'balchen']